MAWRRAVLKWAKTQLIRSQSASSRSPRLNVCNQQRCGFRQEAKRTETKKGNSTQEPNNASSEMSTSGPSLLRPMLFTVGFTGCSFGTASILMYESLKSKVETAKDKERQENVGQGSQDMAYWHEWWNQLSSFQRQLILLVSVVNNFWSSLTEGQKTVTGIIAVNVGVLCCWRIPSMQRTMIRYFTSNPAAKTQCIPMILSCFSHYSVMHMMANMYVLWMFSSAIVSLLGKEQFLAFYMSGGVFSTMVSYICKTATGRFYPSLGASGAVMAVLALVCTEVPDAKLRIIFLPMVTLTAGNVLKALVAMDTAGLVLGWRLFHHAAHLGGALFGVLYLDYVHKVVWLRTGTLLKMWHNIRSRGPRGGPGPQ